jgi:hypothetical protein
VFTARYALSPYIKQIRFVFKGVNLTLIQQLTVENYRTKFHEIRSQAGRCTDERTDRRTDLAFIEYFLFLVRK